MNVFNILINFLDGLFDALNDIMSFFTTPIELGDWVFTPIEFMFGAGLVLVLGVVILKFVV